MSEIKKKFKNLIEKEKEVLDFLDSLNSKERKSLVPLIKELYEYYCTWTKLEDGTSGMRRGKTHQSSLHHASYYCMTQRDYTREIRFLDEDFHKDEITNRFRPEWLNQFLNTNPFNLTYQYLTKYLLEGWFKPSKELIATTLVASIWDRKNGQSAREYSMSAFFEYEITLKEHIWYVFTQETNIAWMDSDIIVDGQAIGSWKNSFKQLIEDKKMDRQQILQQCLHTSTRNFNKVESGWFFNLFNFLNPDVDELLSLQADLFLTFNSLQSKPINESLKHIKKISTLKTFKAKDFLEAIPSLLTSEVKSILNSTLMILDKIASKNKSLHQDISILATQALANQDEKIQVRAAKIILKYANKSKEVKEELAIYYTDIFSTTKELLVDYKSADFEEMEMEENLEYEISARISSDNQMPKYETRDELIFFFSQAFENNEVYSFDLFLENLPKLDSQLDAPTFEKLEPAFQRALKVIYKDSTKIGIVNAQMGTTFINFMTHLFEQYPNASKRMKSAFDKAVRLEIEQKKQWSHFVIRTIPIETLDISKLSPSYRVFISLLSFAKKIAIEKLEISMLSTPTHCPCWLEANTFIHRLKQYQDKKQTPCLFDFQIAISRLVFDENKNLKATIKKQIKGEYKDILLYLIDNKVNLDLAKCKNPSYWLPAIYRKNVEKEMDTFLAKFDNTKITSFLAKPTLWQAKTKASEISSWNYKKKLKEKRTYFSNELIFEDLEKEKENAPKRILDSFYHQYILRDFVKEHKTYYRRGGLNHAQDDRLLLLFSPFQPDAFLSVITQGQMFTSKAYMWNNSVLLVLRELTKIWSDFGKESYLFFAGTLLYSDKTIRQLAAELWFQAVSQQKINIALLGATMGKMERIEYAALKRFTDLMIGQMIKVSKTHDRALEQLLLAMIPQMGDKPIRGTKKLLEVYFELLQLNQSKLATPVNEKLATWADEKSLKAISKKLKNLH